MRILIALYKYFPYGGLQRDTVFFAKAAQARGHSVSILTTEWDGERPDGISLVFCKPTGWSNHARMASFERHFRELLAKGEFDVSLAMNRVAGGDFYFVADTCMADYLPTKHSRLALALLPRYRVYLRQEAEICAQGGSILFCIAPAQKEAYQRIYHLPEERLFLLPPGIESCFLRTNDAEQRRAKKRAELGLREEDVALILVGTNLLRKGADRVMAAMAACRDERSLRFLLAGGDKPEEVAAMAKQAGVEEQMMFLGPRKDVADLMLAADLMVHPAREEGTGTVLVEALAAGCPVICAEECGFSPYVQEATGTVVSAPFCQEALDTMLRNCLNRLPELSAQTIRYAQTQDFTSRHRVAVEQMELLHRMRKRGDRP